MIKLFYLQHVWDIIKLFFLQGSMGPPGREGLSGPRGEPVSHFQSLAGLSNANRRQTRHTVQQTYRNGHKVALRLFLLLCFHFNFLILSFFFFCNPGQARWTWAIRKSRSPWNSSELSIPNIQEIQFAKGYRVTNGANKLYKHTKDPLFHRVNTFNKELLVE